MIEGSGSISLTNGSGFGSGRPKNIWILRIQIWIRIGNTVLLIRKAIHTQCFFNFLTNLMISLMNLSPLGRRKEMGAAFLWPVIGARRRRISPYSEGNVVVS
jgi:hypothetical protein